MSTEEYKPLVWDDATIGRYWRWQARYPGQYFTNLFGDRIAHELRHYIEKGRRVLDYGCGMGFLCRHLTAFGAEVWATDVSPEAVNATNIRNQGVARFHGARTLDDAGAASERFDRILSVEVVEHLDDKKLIEFFSRMRDFLDEDGIVVITTPNEEDLGASEIYCPSCDHVFHRWQHLRSFSSESLNCTVEANGFEVVHTFTTDFASSLVPNVWDWTKSGIKRLMGRPIVLPHLVCVARAK